MHKNKKICPQLSFIFYGTYFARKPHAISANVISTIPKMPLSALKFLREWCLSSYSRNKQPRIHACVCSKSITRQTLFGTSLVTFLISPLRYSATKSKSGVLQTHIVVVSSTCCSNHCLLEPRLTSFFWCFALADKAQLSRRIIYPIHKPARKPQPKLQMILFYCFFSG